MFSVNFLPRYLAKTIEIHFQAINRMFCYIKGTPTYDIFYQQYGNTELTIYTNNDYEGDLGIEKVHENDYEGDLGNRKSTSDCSFLLSSEAISWS